MPATATKSVEALGTGRRKTSVARVRIRAGNGKITINERELEDVLHDRPGPQRGRRAAGALRRARQRRRGDSASTAAAPPARPAPACRASPGR